MESPETPISSSKPHLLPRVSGVAVVNAIGAALLLLLNLVLARIAGERGVGAYNFAWAWIEVIVVFSMLGMDKLAMRDVAYHLANGAWGKLQGLVRGSTLLLILATVMCAGILAGAMFLWFGDYFKPVLLTAVLIGMTVVPFRALAFHLHGVLLGLKKPLHAQIPMFICQPLFTIMIFIVLVIVYGQAYATGTVAVTASSVSAFGVAGLSAIYCLKYLPREMKGVRGEYDLPQWLRVALPMMFLASMTLLNTRADIIMIGLFKTADDAGIYAVSSRIAEFIRFGALTINPVIAGLIAQHHAQNQREKLKRVVRSSSRLLLLWSVLSLAVLVSFGYVILGVFGEGFHAGYVPLLILAVGQFMTLALGPVDSILLMTGHHYAAAYGLVIATLLNVVLNILLIPILGMTGAAIATAVSASIWSSILAFAVIKRMHFRPFAF
ncbi:polysaccharide biosynthesis C-terminal domain-containing protein [Poriferisphaera sp. WC338]|uniref:oligosaccharide flippase family protein n=1 Tax=Poriferisphaera sp. WC338 TaxID=3425129 RepID=UPI003D81C0B8